MLKLDAEGLTNQPNKGHDNEEGGDEMKTLVNHIAQALVDEPYDVMVSEIKASHTRLLELKVAKSDVGKIIGRHGRTAGALRTIINAVSAKHKEKTILEIIE